MPKKSLFRFMRIAATSALLVYVLHKAGLFSAEGWQDLLNTFVHANLSFILASFGIGFLMNLSSATKWLMLTRALELPVNLRRLLAYYMIGKFFNLVLPSSVGGDVIRIQQLGQHTGRYADATASVFVERFTGLTTLVFLALIAVVVNLNTFDLPWLTVTLGIGAVAVGAICWLIVDERPFKLVQNRFAANIPFLQTLLTKIGKFRQAVLSYQQAPYAIHWALLNSLVFYFLAIANVWITLLAFGADVSFMSMIVAVPIIMFIMNLPISVGGIGLMEFAYSLILGLMGIKPALAISTALFIRTKTLVDAGFGGILYSLMNEDRIDQAVSAAQKEKIPSLEEHQD
ncbi:MAG: flippase-like domain-containing protein [Cyanobacteria bacterium RM1_2_2]|nr:flippase-like domain-containing protein [Cyanobacteria bacterium RM1_2_2]